MEELFIKKYWEESDTTFYLHFKNGSAIRQIELSPNGQFLTSTEKPFDRTSMLYDQPFDDLEGIGANNLVSKSDFEKIWSQYDNLD